jgi:anti-sigma B factor antagonist
MLGHTVITVAASDLEILELDGCTLVRVPGPRLDAASAPALKIAVMDLVNTGRLRVVLSLSRVEQMDSSGLGALISLHKTLSPPAGRLVLCEVPARVHPLLKLMQLDRILTQAADPVAAAVLARAG